MKSFPLHFVLAAVLVLTVEFANSAFAKGVDPIAGQWQWQEGVTVELSEDGQANMRTAAFGLEGKWTLASSENGERKYVIKWQGGQFIDSLTLTSDSRHLFGQNQLGVKIGATRIRGPLPASTPKKQAAAGPRDPVVGHWTYQEGMTFELFDDGQAKFHSPTFVLDGKWTFSSVADGERKYVINWQDGRFVDSLTLSSDTRHLFGRNQLGWTLNATRDKTDKSVAGPVEPNSPPAASVPSAPVEVPKSASSLVATGGAAPAGKTEEQHPAAGNHETSEQATAEARQKMKREQLASLGSPGASTKTSAANSQLPSPSSDSSKIILHTTALGQWVKDPMRRFLTADGERTILVVPNGGRSQAWVDGWPGPACRDAVWKQPSNDPRKVIHGSFPLPMSPDQTRVAYLAEHDGGKVSVVVDGKESPIYPALDSIAFGPLGHHLAYVVPVPGQNSTVLYDDSKVYMVDDGKAGLLFSKIDDITFSGDGQHLAYVGSVSPPPKSRFQSSGPSKSRVMLDGVEQKKQYRSIRQIVLSQDGSHLAYLAGPNSLAVNQAVIDGKESPAYPNVERILMSKSGTRCTFVAWASGRSWEGQKVVDNSKEGPAYEGIGEMIVSSDGKRFAYVADTRSGSKPDNFVVDNGAVGTTYSKCEHLQISPDGAVLTYVAATPQGQLLVVNGKEFGPFASVNGQLVFGDGGRRWAGEVSGASGGPSILIDGASQQLPQEVSPGGVLEFSPSADRLTLRSRSAYHGNPVFLDLSASSPQAELPDQVGYSPNRQHVLKVFTSGAGSSSSQQRLTLDGKPLSDEHFERISHICVSDDGAHYAFTGSRHGTGGDALTRVNVDGKEGPAFVSIDDLAMSPDGRHVAYVGQEKANRAGSSYCCLDGLKGLPFEDIIATTPYDQGERRLRFAADGSLAFFGVLDGQLNRCTYSPEAFQAVPSISQIDVLTAGTREIHSFPFENLHSPLVLASNDTFFGITEGGGRYKKGSLYSCKMDGGNYQLVHSFFGGANDGTSPLSLVLAPDGDLYGTTRDFRIFHYSPKTSAYDVVNRWEDVGVLRGVQDDGTLIAQSLTMMPSDQGSHLWAFKKGGQEAKSAVQNSWRYAVKVGPDGAIYAVTTDSLLRQSTIDAAPVVLHKFVNSPDDGSDPSAEIAFDRHGVLFGYTKAGGADNLGMIYRINPDGSDYKVLYNQEESLRVSGLVVGEDGVLYGMKAVDGFQRGGGFFSLPCEGGKATVLGAYNERAYEHPMIYRDFAIYGAGTDAIFRFQVPRANLVRRATPTVTVNKTSPTSQPPARFVFTAPGREATAD